MRVEGQSIGFRCLSACFLPVFGLQLDGFWGLRVYTQKLRVASSRGGKGSLAPGFCLLRTRRFWVEWGSGSAGEGGGLGFRGFGALKGGCRISVASRLWAFVYQILRLGLGMNII